MTTEQSIDRLLGKLEGLLEACEIECSRCANQEKVFIEPSTLKFTHCLGGNFCSADKFHKRAADVVKQLDEILTPLILTDI